MHYGSDPITGWFPCLEGILSHFFKGICIELCFTKCLSLLMEKAMAPHSSTLAWKIPGMEEPGRLQSMGSLRVGHDWATSLSIFTFMHGERNGNPLQCSCLENPRDRGAWWAAVCGVAQSQTQLKRLSSNSSMSCQQSGHQVVNFFHLVGVVSESTK